eukprot:TRINITY_DN17739_c1_g2_i1.p1 TRINITY_DN17739_c1_g2~~TRINITY_DN17739_c1_g2_i1.p1  ORF type:complete len:1031 (+),score=195.52 TRINITY_DN17739_c1_g2_i1:96-3095(+)
MDAHTQSVQGPWRVAHFGDPPCEAQLRVPLRWHVGQLLAPLDGPTLAVAAVDLWSKRPHVVIRHPAADSSVPRQLRVLGALRRAGLTGVAQWELLPTPELEEFLASSVSALPPVAVASPLCTSRLSRSLVRFGSSLPLAVRKRAALGVVETVAALHSLGVCHGGISCERVLLDDSAAPTLCGFGAAFSIAEPPSCADEAHWARTPVHRRPPEVLSGVGTASPAVDVWQCGVVIAEAASGRPLLAGGTIGAVLGSISAAEGGRWGGAEPLLAELLGRCLLPHPAGRCSAAEAARHPWFDDARAPGAQPQPQQLRPCEEWTVRAASTAPEVAAMLRDEARARLPSLRHPRLRRAALLALRRRQGAVWAAAGGARALRGIMAAWCPAAALPPPPGALPAQAAALPAEVPAGGAPWARRPRFVGVAPAGRGWLARVPSPPPVDPEIPALLSRTAAVATQFFALPAAAKRRVGYAARGQSGCRSEIIEWDGAAARRAPRPVRDLHAALVGYAVRALGSLPRLADGAHGGGWEQCSVLRVNYYHPCAAGREAVVCAEHADMSLLTVATADAPGFQRYVPREGWQPCAEHRDLVAFPGKLLWMLGGGDPAVLPTFHRVVASPGAPPRLSITLFLRPGPSAVVPDPRLGPGHYHSAHELMYGMNEVPWLWREELRQQLGPLAFDAISARTKRYLRGEPLDPGDAAFTHPAAAAVRQAVLCAAAAAAAAGAAWAARARRPAAAAALLAVAATPICCAALPAAQLEGHAPPPPAPPSGVPQWRPEARALLFQAGAEECCSGGVRLRRLAPRPPVYAADRFLTPEEVAHFTAVASEARFEPSFTDKTASGGGGRLVDRDRTSTFAALPLGPAADPVAASVAARAAGLIGLPATHVEPLQLVRYEDGQEFGLHHDAGCYYPECGRVAADLPGKRRLLTVFIYLTTAPQDGGGETEFPVLGLRIPPQAGFAAAWANLTANGEADPRVVHRACPVRGHLKLGINAWVCEAALR